MIYRRLLLLSFVIFICTRLMPTSAQESTPEPDQIALSEVITATDEAGNVLTVRYPEGWGALSSNGQVQMGSSISALADFFTQNPYDDGGVGGNVGAFPRDFVQVLDLPLTATPLELIDALTTTLFVESESTIFEEPIPARLNGISGALMRGVTAIDSMPLSVVFVVLAYEDSFIFVNFSGRQADIEANEETIFAIAVNARFTGPDDPITLIESNSLSQIYTYDNPQLGTVSFAYPEGWVVAENDAVLIANNANVMTRLQNQSPINESGQFAGQVIITDLTSPRQSPITPASTASSVLNTFIGEVLIGLDLETPREYLINGLEVASVRATAPSAFGTIDLWVIFVKINGGFILFSFNTLEGEMGLYEDAIWAIVGSVNYELPQ